MTAEAPAITTIACPFTILIDSQEKAPWPFSPPIRARSRVDARRRVYGEIQTRTEYLGVGQGDYTLAGDEYRGRIAIERKSVEDLQGTLLGFRQRRDRFCRELENLACMDCAAVICEGTIGQVLAQAPEYGSHSAAENRNILMGTILDWQQEYRVPWIFCDDRRLAELTAFRILEKFWARNH